MMSILSNVLDYPILVVVGVVITLEGLGLHAVLKGLEHGRFLSYICIYIYIKEIKNTQKFQI